MYRIRIVVIAHWNHASVYDLLPGDSASLAASVTQVSTNTKEYKDSIPRPFPQPTIKRNLFFQVAPLPRHPIPPPIVSMSFKVPQTHDAPKDTTQKQSKQFISVYFSIKIVVYFVLFSY
ncbi:hypothetical protein RCL1_004628 [Eukaryota sp. TZLM3-RCL]